MLVLMRKHLLLGWRRQRFLGAAARVAQMTCIPLLVWYLQEEQTRENVRPQLVETICPLLGVFLILTLFTQFVVEVVTDKELKMRYVQQIAGVSQTPYWASYYLYFLLLTTFATTLYLVCVMWITPIYKYSSAFLMFLVFTSAFLQTFFACMMASCLDSWACWPACLLHDRNLYTTTNTYLQRLIKNSYTVF